MGLQMRAPKAGKGRAGFKKTANPVRQAAPIYANGNPAKDYILHLQRTIGNQAAGRLLRSGVLQASLKIGPANDQYEKEADRIAGHVVSMNDSGNDSAVRGEPRIGTPPGNPARQISRTPLVQSITPLQRKKIQLQTKENSVSSSIETSIHSARGGGRPLSAGERAYFEPRFGAGFSGVKIHTGSDAARMSRSINARAFTVGRDIFFGAGQYSPNTIQGKRLLAHELTHTVQQGGYQNKTGINAKNSRNGIQRERIQRGFWGRLWRGVKAVAGWGWNVLKSAGAWAWNLITSLPERIARLIYHCTVGLGISIFNLGKEFVMALVEGFRGNWRKLASHLGNFLVEGFAWPLKLIAKVLDIFGVGEAMDLVFQVIKVNTRTMTSTEKNEAKKVFRNSISYWQVRIDEYSLIAKLGAFFQRSVNMGVTTFHTINFSRKIAPATGNGDMGWLVHELVHVSQMEHVGMQYMGQALHAQMTAGYAYALGKPHLADYNREQQGDIARDYYFARTGGGATAGFTKYINELRAGKL